MPKIVDLIGQRFDRVLVKSKLQNSDGKNQIRWECACDCGNTLLVTTAKLNSGQTRSCGCARKKHDLSNSPEYQSWKAMKSRCYYKKDSRFPDYGGRGITVCDEWKDNFETFYRDMGPRPTPQHTIDRENNDLGYSKENCRWATKVDQNNNTRKNVYYELNGDRKTLAEWCRDRKLNYHTAYYRLNELGWTIEEALQSIEDRQITHDGITKSLRHWCELFGLDPKSVYLRVLRGTSLETIIAE